jgi:hypothetical protein
MKWEYLVREMAHSDCEALNEVLDQLGTEGWELVGFSPYGHAVFKRML